MFLPAIPTVLCLQRILAAFKVQHIHKTLSADQQLARTSVTMLSYDGSHLLI